MNNPSIALLDASELLTRAACHVPTDRRMHYHNAAASLEKIASAHDASPQPHPARAYAAYCQERRDNATGPHDREFWNRQRGAALKAAQL